MGLISASVPTKPVKSKPPRNGVHKEESYHHVRYTPYSNGELHGEYKEFYLSGLIEKGNYVRDERQGPWLYYKEGVMCRRVHWKNGDKHGLYVKYDITKRKRSLSVVGAFVEGKLHGKVIKYLFQTKTIKYSWLYHHGELIEYRDMYGNWWHKDITKVEFVFKMCPLYIY